MLQKPLAHFDWTTLVAKQFLALSSWLALNNNVFRWEEEFEAIFL
jgi:hypothetical protein